MNHNKISPLLRIAALGTLCVTASHAAPGWLVEKFSNVPGSDISQLTSSSTFYAPSESSITTSSSLPNNTDESYGTRIRGYVVPSVTGLYSFWESGDDAVQLFLSPDANPINKQLVAFHDGWTSPQEWTKFSTQRSREIPLVAGQRYYIEVLHKEGGGGDNLSIAWTPPNAERQLISLQQMETFDSSSSYVGSSGLANELFTNIAGNDIASLTSHPSFYAPAASLSILQNSETPQNIAENYGRRLRGFVTPTVTGEYTFWESGDDAVQLYLSPTKNSADKQLIAYHTAWTPARSWELFPTQKSRPLRLQAGKTYYIEALQKEGVGGDHLSIAWSRDGEALSIITNQFLSSWKPALNDLDSDFLPDSIETALGLNPLDLTDAYYDQDGDGISNLQEYRAFSNPLVMDSVAGNLTDEIWFQVPGDKLNRSVYKAVATRDSDLSETITTTQAFDKGEAFVRRIRGYIVAPETGEYQFWGSADDDVDFHLSTNQSKFQLKQIISNNVLSFGQFDIDPSQKSPLIKLVAGEHYYFELWHKEGKGGAQVSLAWKAPSRSRELIPAHFLRSFARDPDDLDDDGIPDAYELANGLSTKNNGRSAGSTDGAYGDLDGDGLSNHEEWLQKTAANNKDSDGDGVSDFDEVNFFGSATLANSIGAFKPVTRIAGSAYRTATSEWLKQGEKARQNSRRGSVTYLLTVPVSGIHALKFSISSVNGGSKSEQYDFHIKLNGQHLEYKSINILPDGSSTLALLTPWLQAGQSYDLELFVDNSYNFRRVSINSLEVLSAGGIDSNANSIPDWTEIRIKDLNGLDAAGTIHSKTSPAVIEGKAKHLGLLSTNASSPIAAPNGRFFTELVLTPQSPISLDFSFENNALQESRTVHWLPTNLKNETKITLRQGDSLLLTAFDDALNASLESYRYSLNGTTNTNRSDKPSVQLFASPGLHSINFSHIAADGIITSAIVSVEVLAKVNIPPPICIVGHSRPWTAPIIPAGAVLSFDSNVLATPSTISNSYTLSTSTPINQAIQIKSANGLILGTSEVKSASVRSSDQTGPMVIASTATHDTLQMAVVTYGDLNNAEIQCQIIIGGVTYTDGTTIKTLKSSDFDAFGTHQLLFHKLKTAHSNCHRFSIWANGVRIANYN